MPQLDFWLFHGSTYSYLTVMRIGEAASEAGVDVVWRPFSLRTINQEAGFSQGPFRGNPPKLAYMWRDLARRATVHGLDYSGAPDYPIEKAELLANKVGIVAAEGGWCPEYSTAFYRTVFGDGKTRSVEENIAEALTSIGQDPKEILAVARSDEVDARLTAETEAAKSAGVFGSPSFVVDGELFWGDDRLEDALEWCTGRLRV